MEEKVCPSCGEVIAGGSKFCPKCGTEVSNARNSRICPYCGQENESGAVFCKSCGKSFEPQPNSANTMQNQTNNVVTNSANSQKPEFLKSKNFIFGVAVVLIMIIGGFSSYHYSNKTNENKYLSAYSEAARDIESVNGILSTNIKNENLKKGNLEEINKSLQENKEVLDNLSGQFSGQKPFKNYERQHSDTIILLQKESALLESVMRIISNPTDAGSDSVMENIKENIASVKELSKEIQVPNASFVSSVDLDAVSQQLSVFVAEQKQIKREKAEKLQLYETFFREMDDLIQKYEATKKDTGTMRDGYKKEGFIWNDYFSAINRVKFDRSDLRNEAQKIVAPNGTQTLKQNFINVLDTSVLYCETLYAAANLRFNHYMWESEQKEKSADAINAEVQSSYAAFRELYQTEKKRLTNVNNL